MHRSRVRASALALAGFVCLSSEAGSAAPQAFGPAEFQPLLQSFVDAKYGKSFLRLGDESDFDHAHLLFSSESSDRPVAILYHTQELSSGPSLDPRARNWLQRVSDGAIEDAALFERRTYPRSAAWDWFVEVDLPVLRKRHTILDKMLDPFRLAVDASLSRQWVFESASCSPPGEAPGLIRVSLPKGIRVCLRLTGN
ncbi:MAG: hypothetical protein WC943_07370 [Elusimicrobiota bacterium]|jgi:hypothetical protein